MYIMVHLASPNLVYYAATPLVSEISPESTSSVPHNLVILDLLELLFLTMVHIILCTQSIQFVQCDGHVFAWGVKDLAQEHWPCLAGHYFE